MTQSNSRSFNRVGYEAELDIGEVTPRNDQLTRLMWMGYNEAWLRLPFRREYDTWSRDWQLQYEVGRSIFAMLRSKRMQADWQEHEPITALHERIGALGFQPQWWGEFIDSDFFILDGDAAAEAWRRAQPHPRKETPQ